MKKQVLMILVLAALVIALAPSLVAQNTVAYNGRTFTLVTNGTIEANVVKLTNSGGSPAVFQPLKGYRGAPNGPKVDLRGLKNGENYSIIVPTNQRSYWKRAITLPQVFKAGLITWSWGRQTYSFGQVKIAVMSIRRFAFRLCFRDYFQQDLR